MGHVLTNQRDKNQDLQIMNGTQVVYLDKRSNVDAFCKVRSRSRTDIMKYKDQVSGHSVLRS